MTTPHPLAGGYCGCNDRITSYNPQARTECENALQVDRPVASFQMHKAYMARTRKDSFPYRKCFTCKQPLVLDELPFSSARELLDVCRRIDAEYAHLTSWHSSLEAGAEQVIVQKLFIQLGDWWNPTDLPCIRAALNTLWQAELSGVSLMIFAAVYKTCTLQKRKEKEEADRAEELHRIAEQERKRAQLEQRRLAAMEQQETNRAIIFHGFALQRMAMVAAS